MDLGLKGKLVLVTGSTEGIGFEIARVFLEQGARVVINGRSEEKLNAALKKLQTPTSSTTSSTTSTTTTSTPAPTSSSTTISTATPSKPSSTSTPATTTTSSPATTTAKQSESKEHDVPVYAVQADLANADDAKRLIQEVDKLGELDVLVNNVGIFSVKDFATVEDEEWMNYFNVNVMSTVRLSRYYLPKMLKRNSGRIIVMASEAGMRPIKEMIHYSVTKGAMINLTRGMAELTKGTKVTVNSVLAGPTWTEGVEKYVEGLAKVNNVTPKEQEANYFKTNETTSLLQRFCTVREIADVTVFLASDKASCINGCAQMAEGGIIRHI